MKRLAKLDKITQYSFQFESDPDKYFWRPGDETVVRVQKERESTQSSFINVQEGLGVPAYDITLKMVVNYIRKCTR